MPEFRISYLHRSSQSLDSDYDIGDLLNLLFPLRPTPEVYPFVPFGSMANGNMPALVIADSYYVQLVESYGLKMFGKQDYWYYNHSLYPHQNETPPMRIDKSDMRNKLLQYKVVMVMVSDINMHSCLWSFADEAFLAFHPETKDSQLYTIENSIRFDREWFRFMVKRAREQNVSLEQEIRENAEYTFLSNYQNLEGKTFQDSIQFLRLSIKNNPEWCANVTKKAREANIPVDSMMLLDAIYSYTQSKKNH
jgi:hypothetical protein